MKFMAIERKIYKFTFCVRTNKIQHINFALLNVFVNVMENKRYSHALNL